MLLLQGFKFFLFLILIKLIIILLLATGLGVSGQELVFEHSHSKDGGLSGVQSGELEWKNVSAEFGALPVTLQVYKTTDSLKGRPFLGYYVTVELKDKKLNFTTQSGEGKRYTPSQYYLRNDSPLVVVNGTFFSFTTNQNLNPLIKEGKLIAYNVPALKSKLSDSFYYPTRSAIGITRKRKADVAWLFTDTASNYAYAFQKDPLIAAGTKADPGIKDLKTFDKWRWWKMETAIGGGPVLIQNSKVRITNKEEQMFVNGENDRHPRTAMGYTKNGNLIILLIQGRFPGEAEGATLREEAEILLNLGCVEALNLDGGGSSSMLINGRQTIRPSDKGLERPVPGIFMVKTARPN
ncbi:MAG: phosphodiester glycosidase family protein [Chitinophagaceae bacterium]|nr:MAG: phosphodiester glycosidase family protein [Chitinophagaceae bacterium]